MYQPENYPGGVKVFRNARIFMHFLENACILMEMHAFSQKNKKNSTNLHKTRLIIFTENACIFKKNKFSEIGLSPCKVFLFTKDQKWVQMSMCNVCTHLCHGTLMSVHWASQITSEKLAILDCNCFIKSTTNWYSEASKEPFYCILWILSKFTQLAANFTNETLFNIFKTHLW